MDTGRKNWSSLSRIKEKIKNFFGKTLHNRDDATFGSNQSNLKEDAYKKAHEKLRMY